MGTLYGDAKVPWYEPDFYKAHERYVTGLGHQAENQTVQNTLAARGLTRPTLGHQLRDATQSLWREDLMGPFDPRTGGRRSYSGKVLNDVSTAGSRRFCARATRRWPRSRTSGAPTWTKPWPTSTTR